MFSFFVAAIFFNKTSAIPSFLLGPENQISSDPPSPLFASIAENLKSSSVDPPSFNSPIDFQPEARQGIPIFNNFNPIEALLEINNQETTQKAPDLNIIKDDSFNKFQQISSMMSAILSDAGIGNEEPEEPAEESEESEESGESENDNSRAAIIPSASQWPLVAFSFENAFLRQTCPQIYDDEAEMPIAQTQLDGIINQYCLMISNIIYLKNDQLNSMVAQLRQFVLKKMVFQLASI